MNATQKSLARTLFRLRVHRANGVAYESLLNEVMSYVHEDFSAVKPQGRIGDRKNDGFDRASGTYYQVYAPETPSREDTVAKAVDKAEVDFAGLLDFWNTIQPIKRFRFAYNDKYHGTQPTLEAKLAQIKKDHDLQDAKVFLSKDLEDCFLGLEEDQIYSILGFVPDPAQFPELDFEALQTVLEHIQNSRTTKPAPGKLSAPDFDDKLVYNSLGPEVRTILTSGSYSAGAVEEYFLANSMFRRQEVRDRINVLYREHIAAGEPPDVVFFGVADDILPETPSISHRNAAYILIAYYFESCDVFEDPGSANAAT